MAGNSKVNRPILPEIEHVPDVMSVQFEEDLVKK